MKRSDRKKQLIAQGAVYRVEALQAKQVAHDSLRPDSLARGAFNRIAVTALALFRSRGGAVDIGMQAVLPLLMAGVSTLAKKQSLRKPALRRTLIVGAVAAAVACIARSKKSRSQAATDAA